MTKGKGSAAPMMAAWLSTLRMLSMLAHVTVVRATVGHATPASVILVHGASRTIVHEPGLTLSAPLLPVEFDAAADTPTEGAAPRMPAWLDGAALVHLDGRHPEAALHANRRHE